MASDPHEIWQEELVECPYDPAHKIRPAKLGHHLVKCRTALELQTTSPYYPRLETTVICEYNVHHHVPRKDYHQHLKTCPEHLATKRAMETLNTETVQISGISDIMSGVDKVMNFGNDDDDWDDENFTPYDPSAKIASTPMILPQGLTPSQRRDYRIAKRQGEHHDLVPKNTTRPPPKPKSAQAKPTQQSKSVANKFALLSVDDDVPKKGKKSKKKN